MKKKAIYKVPGGKMIRVALECQDNIIKDIKFTGDFFLYPEKGIDFLERDLKNVGLNDLSKTVEKIIKDNKLVLFGLTSDSIVEVIMLALNQNE